MTEPTSKPPRVCVPETSPDGVIHEDLGRVEIGREPPARSCGQCRVCCELPAVPELGKPVYVPCAHECPRGCAIYPTRPQACREFRCGWLAGLGGTADRPDRTGVMYVSEGASIVAWERTPGAASRGRPAEFIARALALGYSVRVVDRESARKGLARTVRGPLRA